MSIPLTMGSLFDGIAGFPLAGTRQGFVPVWASEIEPFPMKVSKIRFPDMLQLGDITKLNGANLPSVDMVCGGSPCQDLSTAGKRAGLEGARSGLFMEQVRVIKEMRAHDAKHGRTADAVRPRYMVWENVPGAFSSTDGEDFRTVLTEICRIIDSTVSVPRPPDGVWYAAGCIMGDQFSLAWRIYDAQYWGLAQRRKRVYLVADFGGCTAPEILFEQDRLFGDPASGEETWEGFTVHAAGGAGDSGWHPPEDCLNSGAEEGSGKNSGLMLTAGVISKGNGDCFLTPEQHTALSSGGGQAGQGYPCVLAAAFSAGASPTAGSIGYHEECAPTLKASDSGTNMVPSILCLNHQGGKQMDLTENMTGALRAQEHGHQPLVMATQQSGAEICQNLCPTITASAGMSGNNQPVLFENHGIDSRYTGPHDVAPTMSARYGTGGNNVPLVSQSAETEADESKSYCIAGNIIDRQDHNGGNGIGVQPDISYTLNTADRHCVFSQQRSDEYAPNDVVSTQSARQYKDATDLVCDTDVAGVNCRAGSENGDLCGTLQSHPSGGYSLNALHPVRTGKLIRRLTPLECERLQGFPDHWTDIPGACDSARYKALGNSVAIPCVEHVLRGITYFLLKFRNERE
jgi:Site-specific DNA methylase